MKSCEERITSSSNYYVYSPSRQGKEFFFYPLQCGHFYYLPGYSIKRDSFDSFLLMYIKKGTLTLDLGSTTHEASTGFFVFIDCYQPHAYFTENGCECLWCHFDGITARAFYQNIVERLGNVFSTSDSFPVYSKLSSIYKTFQTGSVVREPVLSRYINDILTEFMLYTPANQKITEHINITEQSITYINEHFADQISIEKLASIAKLSPYYFIRIFKKETGFTPHEYLINTRMATAQYLLKNTKLSIKDICFKTGFSNESIFCSAFKKHMQMTTSQYRNSD